MDAARNLLAGLVMHTPVRIRSLQGMPVVGDWLHSLSQKLLPSHELVWTRVRRGPAKGIWLELNPRTGRDYAAGHVETLVQQAIVDHLRSGMVFYDLGANIGLFSLLASRLVGEDGKVFSFEPDYVSARRLRGNMERNRLHNVVVVEAGVGASTGKLTFLSSESSSPDRGVGKFAAANDNFSGDSLQCYALDDLVHEFPLPDAIKCDVEGMEAEVILGARNLLASCRPVIIFEIHSETKGKEVESLCRGLGYEVRAIDANHLLAEP
ncbi:MAG TPA: FkbM family methyltransferase [Candidatus Acidoferrales bacterium]|nr:FkbM family methyltransferase [Candidatus Acidoferrales bacterium]